MRIISACGKKSATPRSKAELESKSEVHDKDKWSNERIERLIHDFGLLMENGETPAPYSAKDIKFLPYPKSDLKRALLAGFLTAHSHEMRCALLDGLLTLCQYQEGVGECSVGGDALVAVSTSEKDISSCAAFVKSTLEEYESKWSKLIARERIKIIDGILRIAEERKLEKETIELLIVHRDLIQKGHIR